jgi:uncharacterized protein YxjI
MARPGPTIGTMGLLRRDKTPTVRYQLRERMISIGDDYWIEDDAGNKRYRVNGKAFRVRDTWVLEDPLGTEQARIREKMVKIRDTIKIELPTGEAKVKKALIGFRDRFYVDVDNGDDLKVHGNIVDHEYEIEREGDTIATVSKKWFRVRDTYGVEIDERVDPVLILSVTVALDAMSHD